MSAAKAAPYSYTELEHLYSLGKKQLWKFIKRILMLLFILILAYAGYLCFWPVDIKVTTWELSALPAAEGVLAPNDLLSKAEPFGVELPADGPEDIVFDREGHIYTGLTNGQIIKMSPDGASYQVYADVGGWPLGLNFDKEGNLYIANCLKGLQVVTKDKQIKTLVTEVDGKSTIFANSVAVSDDGLVYFTNSSYKYPPTVGGGGSAGVILEAKGRIISYDPRSGESKALINDLRLSNGIVMSPDQSYFLYGESGTGKLLVYYIKGPKAGQSEVIVKRAPGLPDNLHAGPNSIFWIALFNNGKSLDLGANSAFVGQMLLKLPAWLLINKYTAPRDSAVVAIDSQGKFLKYLQDGKGVIPNVSAAVEKDGWLYLGNLSSRHIYRLKIE